jgi:hypothetical protein
VDANTRAVMYGTADGSEGPWYAATAATDGVDFDTASPAHARPVESFAGADAPQLMRISCPAATAGNTTTLSSRMRRSRVEEAIRLFPARAPKCLRIPTTKPQITSSLSVVDFSCGQWGGG